MGASTKVITLQRKKALAAYLIILPAAALIFTFKVVPVFAAMLRSLFDYHILKPEEMVFTGLANYFRVFNDPVFFRSLKTTFVFALGKIVLQLLPAFFLALFLQRKRKGVGIIRTFILIPTATSLVVVSVIWGLLYDPNNGLFNSILAVLGLPQLKYFTSARQALGSLLAMMVWKDMGFITIIFLAGLQDIPATFYEAATVDGAGAFTKLSRITLPLLKRTTVFLVIITTMWSFQVFTPVYINTKGGPQYSTNVLVYYIFERGFIRMEMGYALAMSVILFFVIMVIGIFQNRLIRADFEY
jgi:ABC-type sugar transport system permease subunit